MTKEQITQVVVAELQRIQQISGRDCPPIDGNTVPLNDLPGFDSLNGMEATSELERTLGPLGVDSIFVSSTGNSARTVATIVNQIAAHRAKQAAA